MNWKSSHQKRETEHHHAVLTANTGPNGAEPTTFDLGAHFHSVFFSQAIYEGCFCICASFKEDFKEHLYKCVF